MAGGPGPIQHRLEALLYPSRRLWLREPERREDAENIGGIDLIDPARPNEREGVVAERVDPLLAVLGAFPRVHMFGVNEASRGLEGWDDLSRLAFLGKRIAAAARELPILLGFLARLAKRYELNPA